MAQFAQWYRRLVSSNIDLLSLFRRWRLVAVAGLDRAGPQMTVCSTGNVVCLVENGRVR